MENSTISDYIPNEENVIRYLKKRFYDSATGQWSTDVFELRKGEEYISVCREAMLPSVDEGLTLSFPERMRKSITAYTLLGVGAVRKLSSQDMQVDVIPMATESNPSHAGIFSSVSGVNIVGIPINPGYYNLQGKLLELALPNIVNLIKANKETNN